MNSRRGSDWTASELEPCSPTKLSISPPTTSMADARTLNAALYWFTLAWIASGGAHRTRARLLRRTGSYAKGNRQRLRPLPPSDICAIAMRRRPHLPSARCRTMAPGEGLERRLSRALDPPAAEDHPVSPRCRRISLSARRTASAIGESSIRGLRARSPPAQLLPRQPGASPAANDPNDRRDQPDRPRRKQTQAAPSPAFTLQIHCGLINQQFHPAADGRFVASSSNAATICDM